jgi:osmotically-inducible protein OsmY
MPLDGEIKAMEGAPAAVSAPVWTPSARIAGLASREGVSGEARQSPQVQADPNPEQEIIAQAAAVIDAALAELGARGRVVPTASGGLLCLKGVVSSHFERDWVERATRRLDGVTGVRNLVEIASPLRPEEIRRRVRAALIEDAAGEWIAEASDVAIEVDGAVLTLEGRVASWTARERAQHAAWGPGVSDIRNELEVEPWPFARPAEA